MKRIAYALGGVALVAAGLAAASLAGSSSLTQTISTITGTTGGGHTPVTICHKPAGENPLTLVVDDDAVPGHLGHGDHLGPCTEDDNPPPTTGTTGTIGTQTAPTPPPKHDCTFTGAGQNGAPGNDDCAPLDKPKPTITVEAGTSQLVCPPNQVVTQTVTVTRTVQGKPKIVTKVVNHVKTRVVYRTREIVKIKKIYVPGMHKNGVEGSG